MTHERPLAIYYRPGSVPVGPDLHQASLLDRLSFANVAGVLGNWPNRVSELEPGVRYDNDMTLRHGAMLAGINSSAAGMEDAA